MKLKPLLLLFVAGGCGLVAVLGVQQLMTPGEGSTKVKILVASKDINRSIQPDETNTEFKEVDPEEVPEGAITSLEEINKRYLKFPVVAGDIIFEAKLTEDNNPSTQIPDGQRVVTVKVNQTTNHSGLMRPGDRVDVVLTYSDASLGRKAIKKAKTILQYIEVFAVDSFLVNEVRDGDNVTQINAKNVSLRVDPEQAKILQLAQTFGTISLIMRSKDDTVIVQADAVDINQVLGIEPKKPQAEYGSHTNLTNNKTGTNPKQPRNTNVKKAEKKKGWPITIYAGGTPTTYDVAYPKGSKNVEVRSNSTSP